MRLFYFSRRRPHTRWPRDWSSDVCSSDLRGIAVLPSSLQESFDQRIAPIIEQATLELPNVPAAFGGNRTGKYRSEERRVGKATSTKSTHTQKKKRDGSTEMSNANGHNNAT